MKTYNFKTINPYAIGNDPKHQELKVKLPDDMKLCMNYTYPNSDQQFYIFFYPYNEWLFEYINSLTQNKGYGLNHAHVYKIGDYMVGNISNVHYEGAEGTLPTETLDELNERFLNVFGNHLIKIEEETVDMRFAEQELKDFAIFSTDEEAADINKWPEDKKKQYTDTMTRYKNASKTPFYTLCIKRFLGFVKDEELVIKTATVWGTDPTRQYCDDHYLITHDDDKWFMLMDTYNCSNRRRLTIEDTPELWNELQQRQNEINSLLERK